MIRSIEDVIQVLQEHGIELCAQGDDLHVDAPPGVLPRDLEESLKEYKDEILPILSPRALGGHQVAHVIWETEKMVIFADPEGRLWRQVHSWGMTWPIIGSEKVH